MASAENAARFTAHILMEMARMSLEDGLAAGRSQLGGWIGGPAHR
jgi:hypothetical protein